MGEVPLYGLVGLILGMLIGLAGVTIAARCEPRRARTGRADPRQRQSSRPRRFAGKPSWPPRRKSSNGARSSRPRSIAVRRDFRDQERRLDKRTDMLDQKLELINKKEERASRSPARSLADQQEELRQRQAEVKQTLASQLEHLQRICRLSSDDAREMLLKRIEDELSGEVGSLVLKYQAIVQESCQQKSREILTTTIQRYAASHTAEMTVSTVDIPNDEMKGRIIGREGRNIRAFEKATGVDVIVDDTPGVVIVTGFDSIRREIAKIALERLIQDGRIHPTRIEEIVKETQEDMEQHIRRLGTGGGPRGQRRRPARKAAGLSGPASFPHQLFAERAEALAGSGVLDGAARRRRSG